MRKALVHIAATGVSLPLLFHILQVVHKLKNEEEVVVQAEQLFTEAVQSILDVLLKPNENVEVIAEPVWPARSVSEGIFFLEQIIATVIGEEELDESNPQGKWTEEIERKWIEKQSFSIHFLSISSVH